MGVFVQVISERSETAALVITTNLPFSEWTQVFANARLCKALGDDSYGIPVYDTTRTALGELLYRLKYRGDQSALASIVDSVLAFLGQWKPPADLIVPVPPSNAAGKNQPVILIARELERLSDTELCNGCVVKSTPTEQLKNVHVYDERVKILRNAFTVGRAKVEDRKVLLLDDLFRSGATLSAVTEALYNVGVEEVYALTITRTRRRS
jgi:predicted amidophosphoribosyltransferase